MRRATSTVCVLALSSAFAWGGSKVVSEESLDFCKQELKKIQNSDDDVGDLIRKWQAVGSQCAGTGLYEYQLSVLYARARDYDNSKRAIEKGLTHDTVFEKELHLAKGDILLHQGEYAEAEKAYRSVVERYPEWYMGLNYLGFTLFAQGENAEAVEYLNKANAIQESADAYRTLTLAHYLLDNFELSVDSLNRAFSLDASVAADRDPMVAGIRSYAELGRFDMSRKLLAMLLSSDPNMKADPEYLKAGLFLRQKMIDAGKVVE